MFDYMFLAILFIYLDENGNISAYSDATGICILTFGEFILSFPPLLYLLTEELSILQKVPSNFDGSY